MKKLLPAVMLFTIVFTSCSEKKETAASIAREWCDLNGKVYSAKDDKEKEEASTARSKFEKEVEDKYKSNEAFMKEIETEIEKCEDASEGKPGS